MTISISASGIAIDGPLVAGEKVAVSVSGISLAAEDRPTLALIARFPDALLASVELAEDAQTPGTWTGELDTATKQTALFFATARADERRDAALELVAGRVSLARLTVPMANSALCPKPDGSPFASPVYIPVPGPRGEAGLPGPLRGRQYAYTVADGDRVEIPADATSVVVSTEAEGPISVRLVPPELADGDDFSFAFIAGEISSSASITARIGNQYINMSMAHVFLVFRDGEDFVARDLGS